MGMKILQRKKYARRQKCTAVAMLPFLLTACQVIPVEEELPAAPVIQAYEVEEYDQTAVMRGDLVLEKTVFCRYVPARQETLSFGLSGEYIEKVYVTQGQQVQTGELLAELEKSDLPEQISQKEYQLQVLNLQKEHLLENQALELERQDVWLANLAGKQKEEQQEKRDDVEADFQQQLQEIEDSLYIEQLRLTELKKELADRQIYAGIDGIVTYVRWTQDGQVSVADQKMFTIADMSTTAFLVEGEDAAYFPVGEQAVVICNQQEHTAVSIEGSSLGVAAAGSDFQVAYLQLDQPDPTLDEGDTGYIHVALDSRQDVLYVDKAAVKSADNRQFVYVLNEEGWKVMQDVTTGLETEKYIEITSGLEEGDSVILE